MQKTSSTKQVSDYSEEKKSEPRQRRSPVIISAPKEPESIIGIKGRRRGCKYLVKWKNLTEDECTWETAKSLAQYPEFFLEFKKARKFLPLKVYDDDNEEDGLVIHNPLMKKSAKSNSTQITHADDVMNLEEEKEQSETVDHDQVDKTERIQENENDPLYQENNLHKSPKDDSNENQPKIEVQKRFRQIRGYFQDIKTRDARSTDRRSILQNFVKILETDKVNPNGEELEGKARETEIENHETDANDIQRPFTSTRGVSRRKRNLESRADEQFQRRKLPKIIEPQRPLIFIQPSDSQGDKEIENENSQLCVMDCDEDNIDASELAVDDLMIQTAKEIIGHVIFQKMMFFRLEWDKQPIHENLELKYYPYSRVYRLNPSIVTSYAMKYLVTSGKRIKRVA